MTENGHGRRIAILIGTNEYSKMEKLEFAESDAKEMGKVLLDPEICGFDEVIELIDKNKDEVSKAIEKVFKNAKKDDEILIYFSGHGKPSYKFDLCLLFKDTDPESLLATSLKFDYINECKDQSACNRVVVVLDCCYSGTAGMKGDFLQEMLSSYSGSGTVLLTSTGETGSNIAKENKELKHGVFTHYLLKGLKNWAADDNDDGIITVDDIYRYTFNETKARGLQRPQKKGSYEGEMILGRNPQKIRAKEFEQKKDLLMKYLSSAPSSVLYRSLTILQKMYKEPSALEPAEHEIKPHLESLLNNKIQAETYIEIVKYQEKLQGQKGEEQKQKEEIYKQSEETEKKQREEEKRKKKTLTKRPNRALEKNLLTTGIFVGILIIWISIQNLIKQDASMQDIRIPVFLGTFLISISAIMQYLEIDISGKKALTIGIFLGVILLFLLTILFFGDTALGILLGSLLILVSSLLQYFETGTSEKKILMIVIFLGILIIWISFLRGFGTALCDIVNTIFLGSILILISAIMQYLEIYISGKKALIIAIFLGVLIILTPFIVEYILWEADYGIATTGIFLGSFLILVSAIIQYNKT